MKAFHIDLGFMDIRIQFKDVHDESSEVIFPNDDSISNKKESDEKIIGLYRKIDHGFSYFGKTVVLFGVSYSLYLLYQFPMVYKIIEAL